MKKIIVFLAKVSFIYMVIWTMIYIVFMGLDFTHYLEYFRLAFSGPGEIPALIRIYSLIITFVVVLCLFIFGELKKKSFSEDK